MQKFNEAPKTIYSSLKIEAQKRKMLSRSVFEAKFPSDLMLKFLPLELPLRRNKRDISTH